MFRQLTFQIDSPEQFQEEFESNISRGGIFIPTLECYELREVVDVLIHLAFCNEGLSCQAEVVSQLGEDLHGAGGVAGVAVQFLEPAETLRARLVELTGMPDADPEQLESHPQRRRRHRRSSVRVATEVLASDGPISATAKDISSSGVLVTIAGQPVPIGENVCLKIVHPTSGEEIEVSGAVMRYVERGDGMFDMAVEFEDPDEPATCAKLGDLRAAAHVQRLGGINGSIAAVGVMNLVQMFATSAQQGTLTLTRGEREGRLLFESNSLRHAMIGPVTGAKAVARMLEWKDGEFEFHPSILAGEPEGSALPVDAIMLQALTSVDELALLDLSELLLERLLGVGHEPHEELDKLETAVLDWATLGTSVRELLDALPQLDAEIYQALISMIDRGLVRTL
jgi:Tfp pilus assembly protein PilZ